MIEKAENLYQFLNKLKIELKLNNLQLAKRIDINNEIILNIDEKKQDINDISLGVYRKLISLKDWERNYPYAPFIRDSSRSNLIEGFADYLINLMAAKQLNLTDIAQLEENITPDFIAQICDRQIHPDRVQIGFVKKLLQIEGSRSDKWIENYYLRPIRESLFSPFEVKRFKELVLELRLNILQVNQTQFGEQLGVSPGIVSMWEKGKVDPDVIKVAHFRALANLKGWTVEHLMNFIYGYENQRESLESVLARIKNLSRLEKTQLIKIASAWLEEDSIYESLTEFSQLLKNYIELNNLTLEEASKKLRIKPVKRLNSILDQQELPTNMELLRLVSLPDLLDEDGERYSYEKLKALIFGFNEIRE